MNNNDEQNELMDILLIKITITHDKLDALTRMTLGTYKEILTKEQYRNVYTNFVNEYEAIINDSFKSLSEELENNSFFVRQQFQIFSEIQAMKSDDSFDSVKA